MQRDKDLQRYFDGELGPAQARKVYERLQQSPEDQRRFEAMKDMRSLLRENTRQAVEDQSFDHLWTRVEASIGQQQPLSTGELFGAWLRRYGLVAVSATAALIVAMMLVWPVTSESDTNDCMIESIEVGAGTVSTIFTLDDPDESGETTVIWLDEDEESSITDEGGS